MEKILIVDDNPANIRVLAEMLKGSFSVLAANNGLRAIKIAQEYTPDIILMDVIMPDLDGFETTIELKNNIKTEEIPIIFITAKNDVDDIVRGFSVGGCDYVTKPFNQEELLARVNTHLELKKSKELLKKYISELENKNDELDKMSKTDYLTGLANRRFMMERIKEELARKERNGTNMSILMCDIDHFKKINDSFGHEIGDLVIKEVTNNINRILRKYDIVSRWGGEEFLILLPDIGKNEACIIAEKIRKEVENTKIQAQKIECRVSITIGVTEYDEKISVSDNINNADDALYQGKNSGRNKIEFYSNEKNNS